MLFKPEHIDLIIAGRKTQTRRVCKPGEYFFLEAERNGRRLYSTVFYTVEKHGYIRGDFYRAGEETTWEVERIKWQVGRTYAVQPGRGKPGVWWNPAMKAWSEFETDLDDGGQRPLRIRITSIRQERVQDISELDARAEGYPENEDERECPHCNALYPTGWYDGPDLPCICDPVAWYRVLWDTINTRAGARWADNPLVWALTFEVAR